MADKKPARKPAPKKSESLSPEEKAAMKDLIAERKAAAKRGANSAEGEADLLAKIAAMPEPDRSLATKLHTLIKSVAPSLSPKTWYGMPAYEHDGKVLCFFQSGQKFKTRYATLGFSDKANLDDGQMWPTSFALKSLTPTAESQITQLLKQAIS